MSKFTLTLGREFQEIQWRGAGINARVQEDTLLSRTEFTSDL